MKYHSFVKTTFLATILSTTACSPKIMERFEGPRYNAQKKVLLVGIDGLRPDALKAADTPHLDNLISQGSYHDDALAGTHTVSAPGWSNIFTGVWEEKHGVTNNDFEAPNYEQYPSIFTRLRNDYPSMHTASIVSWEPINEYINKDAKKKMYHSLGSKSDGDLHVMYSTIKELENNDPTLLFTYFGEVDTTGHKYGFDPKGEEYLAKIEQTDKHIGEVLKSLKERENYSQENWLIVVTTDHGGLKKSHSGGSDIERRVFYLVHGRDVESISLFITPTHVDVVPTILKHLEVEVKEEWGLDGIVLGL